MPNQNQPYPAGSNRSASSSVFNPENKRPGFIVVFKKPSEQNRPLLERTLKLKATKGIAARASVFHFEPRLREHSAPKLYRRLGVAVADLEKAELEQLLHHENVAMVVRNRVRTIPRPLAEIRQIGASGMQSQSSSMQLPADPMAAYLTGLRDAAETALRAMGFAGSNGASGMMMQREILAASPTNLAWHLTAINIGSTSATGQGIKVAVLDTGIDQSHPDFQGRITEGVNGASFVPGKTIQDGHGHGTHCAGLIAGPAQPVTGPRYGVAPDVNLFVGKVLNDAGKGTDDQILDAIDWAVDCGAQIISMSLGSERYPGEEFAAPYEAVAKTLLISSPGVLLIAAAGNESGRPYYTSAVGNPAACPSFMSVAAVDEARRIADFSCAAMDDIGLVDISGPGVAVYSSFKGGGYRLLSGTSMATPIVAGVAALHLQQTPNSNAAALWKSLADSVVPLGDASDFGAGLVQAAVSPVGPAGLAIRGKTPAGMPVAAQGVPGNGGKGEVAVSF